MLDPRPQAPSFFGTFMSASSGQPKSIHVASLLIFAGVGLHSLLTALFALVVFNLDYENRIISGLIVLSFIYSGGLIITGILIRAHSPTGYYLWGLASLPLLINVPLGTILAVFTSMYLRQPDAREAFHLPEQRPLNGKDILVRFILWSITTVFLGALIITAVAIKLGVTLQFTF